MQTVVFQQNRSRSSDIAFVTLQLSFVFQASNRTVSQSHHQLAAFDGVLSAVNVRTACQWCRGVQKIASPGDHFVAAYFVVAAAFFRTVFFRDYIGTVQCIVQRTPARVSSVQSKTGIHDRHNQLRTGHLTDFWFYVFSRSRKVVAFRQQVTQFLQEGFVFRSIMRLTLTLSVVSINFRLDIVTLGQQGFVFWCQIIHQSIKLCPEFFCINTCTRNRFFVNEIVQFLSDLNATFLNVSSHYFASIIVCSPTAGAA